MQFNTVLDGRGIYLYTTTWNLQISFVHVTEFLIYFFQKYYTYYTSQSDQEAKNQSKRTK